MNFLNTINVSVRLVVFNLGVRKRDAWRKNRGKNERGRYCNI